MAEDVHSLGQKIDALTNLVQAQATQLSSLSTHLSTQLVALQTDVTSIKTRMETLVDPGVENTVKDNLVFLFRKENGRNSCVGCGFRLNNNRSPLIVTACHNLLSGGPSSAAATNSTSSSIKVQDFTVLTATLTQVHVKEENCIWDQDLDIAVIKIRGPYAQTASSSGLSGIPLAQPGLGGKWKGALAAAQMLDATSFHQQSVALVPVTFAKRTHTDLLFQGVSFCGDSGGPIVDRSGSVVAVHCGLINDVGAYHNTAGGACSSTAQPGVPSQNPPTAYCVAMYGRPFEAIKHWLEHAQTKQQLTTRTAVQV